MIFLELCCCQPLFFIYSALFETSFPLHVWGQLFEKRLHVIILSDEHYPGYLCWLLQWPKLKRLAFFYQCMFPSVGIACPLACC